MENFIKEQRGSALLYVLFFSMFMAIVTMPLLQGSMVVFNSSVNTYNKTNAINAVTEAYEKHLKSFLRHDPDNHTSYTVTETIGEYDVDVAVQVNHVPVPYTDDEGNMEITVSVDDDKASAGLKADIKYINLSNYAVYTTGTAGEIVDRAGARKENARVFPLIKHDDAVAQYTGDATMFWTMQSELYTTTGQFINRWVFSRRLPSWNNPFLVSGEGLQVDFRGGHGYGILRKFVQYLMNSWGGVNLTFNFLFENSTADISMTHPLTLHGLSVSVNYWGFNGAIFSNSSITGVPPFRRTRYLIWTFPYQGMEVNLSSQARNDLVAYFRDHSYNGGPSLISRMQLNRW